MNIKNGERISDKKVSFGPRNVFEKQKIEML